MTRASSRTRTQSFRSGIRTRLTTKPGVSLQRIGVFPSFCGEAECGFVCVVCGELGPDHLDQRQQRRGVEEVHAEHALRPRRRRRDLRDRQRGGVRREDGVLRRDPVQLGEELSLRLDLLHDRLDDEVAGGEVRHVSGQREALDRRVPLRLLELPLLDLAGQEVRDAAACLLRELHRDLATDGLEACLDRQLRDPGAHRPETDDADLLDLPGHGRATLLGLPRKKPLEPRLALGLDRDLDLVTDDLQAGVLDAGDGSLPAAARRSTSRHRATRLSSRGCRSVEKVPRKYPPGRSQLATRRASGPSSSGGTWLRT